jgi:carbonic anhydrase
MGQNPRVLWLGCADSRVSETAILDCKPGDVFVHRNIGNIVQSNDINMASVVEYAVCHLKVRRIVVCGHTKCGAIVASMTDVDLGDTLGPWTAPVRNLRRNHHSELEACGSYEDRITRLTELNVMMGLDVLRRLPSVTEAVRDYGLTLHGIIYDLATAELHLIPSGDAGLIPRIPEKYRNTKGPADTTGWSDQHNDPEQHETDREMRPELSSSSAIPPAPSPHLPTLSEVEFKQVLPQSPPISEQDLIPSLSGLSLSNSAYENGKPISELDNGNNFLDQNKGAQEQVPNDSERR